jgi:sugar (pentulose or hexulose) kinase
LAQVGAGVALNLAAAVASAVPAPEAATPPPPDMVEAYRAAQVRYRALYPALKAAGLYA